MVKFFSLVGPPFGRGSFLTICSSGIFTSNDIVLAKRYNYTAVALASHGNHWHNLHHIMVVDVLSTHSLNYFMDMRRDEIKRLVQKLAHDSSEGFTEVEIRSRLSRLTFSTMI